MSLVPPPSFAIVLRGGRPRKQGQLVMNLEVVGAAEGNGEIVVEAAAEGHVSQQSDTRRRKEEEANTTHYLLPYATAHLRKEYGGGGAHSKPELCMIET